MGAITIGFMPSIYDNHQAGFLYRRSLPNDCCIKTT